MKAVKSLFVLLLAAAAFGSGYLVRGDKSAAETGGRKVLYYIDPMHPAYKSDRPGIAPDCGMALEPVYADEPTPAAATSDRKILHYRDPQAPTYTSDKPGLNPETGHTLEPVYAEAPPMPDGSFHIPPERQQLIGVRFAVAAWDESARVIRTVGKVTYDETRVAHVHPGPCARGPEPGGRHGTSPLAIRVRTPWATAQRGKGEEGHRKRLKGERGSLSWATVTEQRA